LFQFLFSLFVLKSIIIAAPLLIASEISDMADGELVRKLGRTGDAFGSFLDTAGDHLMQFFTYGSASVVLFLRDNDPFHFDFRNYSHGVCFISSSDKLNLQL